MKYLSVLLLLVSSKLLAYSRLAIDDYDAQTGLFFRLMETEQATGALSMSKSTTSFYMNLFVYDPVGKTGRNLFEHNTHTITAVLIASEFDEREKQLDFLSFAVDLKNNHNLVSTKTPEKILVETFDSKSKTYHVWVSPKTESKPQVLFTYQKPTAWHYDAKANMIRVITPHEYSLKVENYTF